MKQSISKTDIEIKAITANLVTMTPAEQQRLHEGIEAMPVNKIISLCQWLQNIILPAVLKRSGNKESADYKQFNAIVNALIWATNALELKDQLITELSNNRLLLEFYRKKSSFYESELMKYTTREDLLLGETFHDCARFIQQGFTEQRAAACNPDTSITNNIEI